MNKKYFSKLLTGLATIDGTSCHYANHRYEAAPIIP